eukprot:Em0053g19a
MELYYNGSYGSICQIGWNLVDATVVCKSLGYAAALVAMGGAATVLEQAPHAAHTAAQAAHTAGPHAAHTAAPHRSPTPQPHTAAPHAAPHRSPHRSPTPQPHTSPTPQPHRSPKPQPHTAAPHRIPTRSPTPRPTPHPHTISHTSSHIIPTPHPTPHPHTSPTLIPTPHPHTSPTPHPHTSFPHSSPHLIPTPHLHTSGPFLYTSPLTFSFFLDLSTSPCAFFLLPDTTTLVINVQLPFPMPTLELVAPISPSGWTVVNCLGTETNVGQCLSGGWGIHNCVHMEDAGVRCSGRQFIRLASGPTPAEGRVELYYNGSPYDQKG